jgi:dipeptidyl aminopeptidase/acylaminoacyl peptidase
VQNGPLTVIAGRGGGIYELGPTGVGRPLLVCATPRTKCYDLMALAWASDGERVAYAGTAFAGSNRSWLGLQVYDFRTHRARTVRPMGPDEFWWFDLAWSTNGRRIAYVSNWTINLVDSAGSGHAVLETGTAGSDRSPTWSPDGKTIAYAVTRGDDSSVYSIRIDGSRRTARGRRGRRTARRSPISGGVGSTSSHRQGGMSFRDVPVCAGRSASWALPSGLRTERA